MTLSSPAFKNFEIVSSDYTGDGRNLSPPLVWAHVPPETREFALLFEDEDPRYVVPFVHWLVYDIAPDVRALPAGVRILEPIFRKVHLKQGRNSYGTMRYSGPLPPVGHGRHRYVFTLFALDQETRLPEGVTREDFLRAIKDRVLTTAQLIGYCAREAIWSASG